MPKKKKPGRPISGTGRNILEGSTNKPSRPRPKKKKK